VEALLAGRRIQRRRVRWRDVDISVEMASWLLLKKRSVLKYNILTNLSIFPFAR
jgi:hypothetical protein